MGMTNVCPSRLKPTWQISPSSRTLSTVARSYAARSGFRLTVVRSEGAGGSVTGDFPEQFEEAALPRAADLPVHRHGLITLVEALAAHAKVEVAPRCIFR